MQEEKDNMSHETRRIFFVWK